MIKYLQPSALFLMLVFCVSCKGHGKTGLSKDTINAATKDTVSSYGPSTMVRNVKQDRNGNILIAASWDGVFRYDPKQAGGKSFTNIASRIGSRRYWDVLEDQRGNLWFATTYSGVYYYDPKRAGEQSFQHFTTTEGLADNRVMCIYEDRAGIIWFGTGGGISRYDPKQTGRKSFQNFTTKEGLSDNDITHIIEDKTGKLWIGTRGEACFYDGKTFTVLRNKDGKAFNNVWGITEDRKGNIWLASDGLWRYSGGTFTKINERGAYAIIEDTKGNLWTTGEVNRVAGAEVWAVTRYEANTLSDTNPAFTEIKSGGPAFLGLLEANDGSIWFGSMNGVYRYDPSVTWRSDPLRAGGNAITDFKSAAGH